MNLLTRRTSLVLLWLGAIALAPLGALAHGDEDHGEKKSPAASGAIAGPRFEAHSDLFEVVGTVERDQLTITVDRYASNEPVRDAKVEVEVGSAKGIASPVPDGSYSFKNAALAQAASAPVTLPVSLTITAGKDADLLAAELTIGAVGAVGAVAAGDAHAADAHADERPRWWLPAGASVLLLIVALVVWRARSRARSPNRSAAV